MNYQWGALRPETTERQRTIVCLVARAEAHAGEEGEVQKILRELSENVLADEAGCLSYSLSRPIGSRTHFAVHARFRGWRAFKHHGVTPHLEAVMPELTRLLATPIALEVFVEV